MADREAIRVLVVDDEPAARRGVRSVLDGWSTDLVVEECRNGVEAVRAIPSFDPHVVLLDVQMPGLDGFDVIREVGADRMPAVVFVTAYDEHALRAFDVAAVDYVVKPFTDERLRQAMDRALKRRSERRAAEVQRTGALFRDVPRDSPHSHHHALFDDQRAADAQQTPLTRGSGHAELQLLAQGGIGRQLPEAGRR